VYQSVEVTQSRADSRGGSLVECHFTDLARIGYSIRGDVLVRTERRANHAARQESFALSKGMLARVTRSRGARRDIMALVLEFPAGSTAAGADRSGTRRLMVIEAVVGRDLRWSSTRRREGKSRPSLNRDPKEAAGD
jgi:hypothetical protein